MSTPSPTTVSVLTPPGMGAVATIAVQGPHAWALARHFFQPASGKPLPETPPLYRYYFGRWGKKLVDEVIMAITGPHTVEIHCHGGVRLVRCLVEELQAAGVEEKPALTHPLLRLLAQAPTRRIAAILLDQWHGACATAFRRVIDQQEPAALAGLARYAPLAHHLAEPWRVAIAGPPNVGKSSLLNALAGYPRAIVSPVPGTTRDAVSVTLAFDGWPVQLIDTAGLRDTPEPLEAAGIAHARQWLQQADLVLWVADAAHGDGLDVPPLDNALLILNKCDLVPADRYSSYPPQGLLVSAITGMGLDQLCNLLVERLVPDPPPPGAPVPFTPTLAEAVQRAWHAWQQGDKATACQYLQDHLSQAEPPPDFFLPVRYTNNTRTDPSSVVSEAGLSDRTCK